MLEMLIQSNIPERTPLYNKPLSIKGSLIFPLMNSAFNFNLYIKDNCSQKVHFQIPLSTLLYTGLIVS